MRGIEVFEEVEVVCVHFRNVVLFATLFADGVETELASPNRREPFGEVAFVEGPAEVSTVTVGRTPGELRLSLNVSRG